MIYDYPPTASPPPPAMAAAAEAGLCHLVWNDTAGMWIAWPAGPPAPTLAEIREGAGGPKESN